MLYSRLYDPPPKHFLNILKFRKISSLVGRCWNPAIRAGGELYRLFASTDLSVCHPDLRLSRRKRVLASLKESTSDKRAAAMATDIEMPDATKEKDIVKDAVEKKKSADPADTVVTGKFSFRCVKQACASANADIGVFHHTTAASSA